MKNKIFLNLFLMLIFSSVYADRDVYDEQVHSPEGCNGLLFPRDADGDIVKVPMYEKEAILNEGVRSIIPFSRERLFEGDPLLPDDRKTLLTFFLEKTVENDLSAMRDFALACLDELLISEGNDGYEGWYLVDIVYTTVPNYGAIRYQNIQDRKDDVLYFAPETTYPVFLVNDTTLSGWQSGDGVNFFYSVVHESSQYGGIGPRVFIHEFSHQKGHCVAHGLIPHACDEYPVQGSVSNAHGSNLFNDYTDSMAVPWLATGYELYFGFGATQTKYIVTPVGTYMYNALNLGGPLMENYHISTNHQGVGDIIYSTSPSSTSIQVFGATQTLSIEASLCATCSVRWYVDEELIQSGKDQTFEHVYSQYDHPVSVLVEIEDTNTALVETRFLKTWTRSWVVVPDLSPSGYITKFAEVDAMWEQGGVQLNWSTEIEIGNDFFSIEKKSDNSFFEVLDTSTLSFGTGSFNYSFFVNENECSSNFLYRIKATSFDGLATYSDTLSLQCPSGEPEPNAIDEQVSTDTIKVYPNPVASVIFIEASGEARECQFFNELGQFVKVHTIKNGVNQIDVSGLNPGVYFLSFMKDSAPHHMTKIVIK